jgi:flagellar hook assembly protein FlgD
MKLRGISNVVSVTVFDEAGNYIRKIKDNMFAGTESSVTWDGTADDSSIVNTGIYIILVTIFDDTGKTIKWKKVCTVLRK